jgi:hypothetical protein
MDQPPQTVLSSRAALWAKGGMFSPQVFPALEKTTIQISWTGLEENQLG